MKCDNCNGDGEKWMLPNGNPFHMRITTLARAMQKVQCWKCHGTGAIRTTAIQGMEAKSTADDEVLS